MSAIRVRLASISLFAFVGLLTGCGDDVPRQQNGGSGGGAGSSAGDGGGGTGGDVGGGGGGGTGGSIGGGGGGGTGGGVAGAGGGAGRGGSGGGGTGGSVAGAGGSAGRGGSGGGGTAGGGTGGGGIGGGGTGGGPPPCYTVTFAAPINGATLTVVEDKTSTCADGFQYDVRITTNAPAGTDVSLYNGNALLRTVQVAAGAALFADIQLASTGQSALSIQFPSTAMCTDPSTRSMVTVNCPATAPTCSISAPTISPTHPALNGVQAPAGDRAGNPGQPYQVTFQVTTNAEDGQPVSLAYTLAGGTTPTTLLGAANGGVATFGVPLSPDGTYEVRATCRNMAGITGMSMLTSYPVDTTAPDLTVTEPNDGQFFGPGALTNGTFKVCGQTMSADAAGLPASLGPAVNNLCIALGGSATCVGTAAVTAVNTPACVDITCPGGAPFNINVTIKDAAGNPRTNTVQGVSCASALPSVQIIAPVSDAPTFTNAGLHILSATAPVGIRDQNAATAGAQATVVACSDRAGTSMLFAGQAGGTLTQVGANVTNAVAVVTDNCPSGLGFVARFAGVTLPESAEGADGALSTATRLVVRVTDAINPAAIGSSPNVDVWVDSVTPVLSVMTPVGLCGSFQQSATAVTQPVTFTAESDRIVVQVANGATTQMYMNPTFASGVATFTAVRFDPGQNDLIASESDPAGNVTTLLPDPCTVIIGSAPVVTFNAPLSGQVLCPVGSPNPGCVQDTQPGTTGWQGNLTVHVSGDGAPITSGNVTFTVGATTLGVAALDSNGNATLANATIPNGMQTIVATTNNIPGRGVGTGQIAVNVIDDLPPTAPMNLRSSIVDRRQVTMRLTWDAPDDGGAAVTGYQIRYARVPIDATNFDNPSVTTAVTYAGNPAAPTQADGINVPGLYVENDYYFAVAATDPGGNRSAITATPMGGTCNCMLGACCNSHLNVSVFPSTSGTNEELGYSLSAGGDLNGDGFSDVLAGTFQGGRAYLFFGSGTVTPGAPSVVFSGAAAGFGNAVAQIGDIDGDTLPDIAIADPINAAIVYIYRGRAVWPATLADTQADYTISGDATYVGSLFGTALAGIGDFTGDGVDDLAIGARGFAVAVGRVVIIPGKAAGFASVALPDAANSIAIDGDATLGRPQFGYRVLGLGHFYTATTGATLVVSAPGSPTSATANAGRVYTFHGQAGTAGAIAIASADHILAGPGSGARIGMVLTNLGPMLGSFPAVGIGNPADALDVPGVTGVGYVSYGTPATGPFANRVMTTFAGTTGAGGAMLGGRLSGRDSTLSLIGNGAPDLVFGAEANATMVTISDGALLAGKTSPIAVASTAEVRVALPAGWVTGESSASLMTDVNGDGYPDFCLGKAFGTIPGAVAVFW